VKGGIKANRRRLIKSVVQSICNSLSDENIMNCNMLFWSTRSPPNSSESVIIWGLAK